MKQTAKGTSVRGKVVGWVVVWGGYAQSGLYRNRRRAERDAKRWNLNDRAEHEPLYHVAAVILPAKPRKVSR